MKRMLLGLGIAALSAVGALGLGASEARAQVPVGSVAYETVAPGSRTVTFGEKVKVRRRFGKTIIKERPVRYVTTTPPVVRETRVIRPAPIIEQQVIQPAPIIERQIVQPAPIIESRYIQPAPVIQRRVIQSDPVIQTRYLAPY